MYKVKSVTIWKSAGFATVGVSLKNIIGQPHTARRHSTIKFLNIYSILLDFTDIPPTKSFTINIT